MNLVTVAYYCRTVPWYYCCSIPWKPEIL